jgi:hypothetical protein
LAKIKGKDDEARKGVPAMINVICDACKKSVRDAQNGINVFYVQDKALCKPCEAKIEETAQEQMGKSKTYSIKEYQNKYLKEMERRCK